MSDMRKMFVIRDQKQGGYADHNPIEGWIWTTLLNSATLFESRKVAEDTIKSHYRGEKCTVVCVEVDWNGRACKILRSE